MEQRSAARETTETVIPRRSTTDRELMIHGTTFIAEPGRQEVTFSREFDAPRDRLFRAYTDPKQIVQWWGPRVLKTRVEKMEVKRGGTWRFTQTDPKGKEYGFSGVYHSVKAPEEITWTFEYEPMPGHVSLQTATFEERGGRTLVKTHVIYQSVEERDAILKPMREGEAESMDRLAELLARAAN